MSLTRAANIPLTAQADDFARVFPVVVERTFTETTGAGVYTATVIQPAGSTLLDIVVNGVALWTATTSALMSVGDAGNAAGYFTAIDLKAAELLAGESISFNLAGGKAGAYIANAQVSPRFRAAATTLSAVVTTVGAAGAAGITRVTFIFSQANSAAIAAVKV